MIVLAVVGPVITSCYNTGGATGIRELKPVTTEFA